MDPCGTPGADLHIPHIRLFCWQSCMWLLNDSSAEFDTPNELNLTKRFAWSILSKLGQIHAKESYVSASSCSSLLETCLSSKRSVYQLNVELYSHFDVQSNVLIFHVRNELV